MSDLHVPKPTRISVDPRHALAQGAEGALRAFPGAVFARGAPHICTRQPVTAAAAQVGQRPWCIGGGLTTARCESASDEQIMEAICVASKMRAGPAGAHALKAVNINDDPDRRGR